MQAQPVAIHALAGAGSRLAGSLAALARAALDAVYPPTCLACAAATAEVGALCPQCWRQMRFIERPYCDRLGTPFEQDLGAGLLSPQAIADPPVCSLVKPVMDVNATSSVSQLS